jgi:hypothetical protein
MLAETVFDVFGPAGTVLEPLTLLEAMPLGAVALPGALVLAVPPLLGVVARALSRLPAAAPGVDGFAAATVFGAPAAPELPDGRAAGCLPFDAWTLAGCGVVRDAFCPDLP